MPKTIVLVICLWLMPLTGAASAAPRPLEPKPGDSVLFGKYSGTEVKLDGEEHLILREDDILGVIEA